MNFGICHLSVIPVYSEKDPESSLVSQLLYGEHFKVIDLKKNWCKIKISHDGQEGWMDRSQYLSINKAQFKKANSRKNPKFAGNLISSVGDGNGQLQPITFGAVVSNAALTGHVFDGDKYVRGKGKSPLINAALYFLHAPEMKGGRTPFGIDSSGLVQLSYRLQGIELPRSAASQAKLGEALSFIEESEAGDLAFFDDKDGKICHVGMILGDHRILHVKGSVRIDRLDHTGIFNADQKKYSHSLRVIKKIL